MYKFLIIKEQFLRPKPTQFLQSLCPEVLFRPQNRHDLAATKKQQVLGI